MVRLCMAHSERTIPVSDCIKCTGLFMVFAALMRRLGALTTFGPPPVPPC